jgi:hypothetical protein
MFFGLEYKASATNPPDPDIYADDGGNPNTPVFTLSGPLTITSGACVEFTISANPAPSGYISLTPSFYGNGLTGFYLDSRCKNLTSNVTLSGSSNYVTVKFKASLPTGVSSSNVILKIKDSTSQQDLASFNVTILPSN